MASHGQRKARGRERAERGASRSEHVLFLRLTAGEHAIYQQVAQGAGLTMSEWARRVLHAQTLPKEAAPLYGLQEAVGTLTPITTRPDYLAQPRTGPLGKLKPLVNTDECEIGTIVVYDHGPGDPDLEF